MNRPGVAIAIVALLAAAGAAVAADEAPPSLRVALTVPSAGYSLKIAEVYEVGDETWVLAEVKRRGGMAAQVISRVQATAPVAAKDDGKIRAFVGGVNWNWKSPEDGSVEFVDDLEPVRTKAKDAGGKLLHKAPEEPPPRMAYIVTFRKDLFQEGVTADGKTLEEFARDRVATVGGEVKAVLGIIHGVSAVLTPQAAEQLRKLPEVAAVEEDGPVQGSSLVRP